MKREPQTSPMTWLVAFALLGLLIYATFEGHFSSSEHANPQASSAVTEIGTHAYIKAGAEDAPIAVDKDSLYEFEKALVARDQFGINKLQSRISMVGNGTHVLVIDKDGYGALRVRVLEGEHEGASGWTDPRWVTKDRVAPPK